MKTELIKKIKIIEEIKYRFKKRKNKNWTSGVVFYRTMLNCTNSLEGHLPPAESAALMIAEEKPHPDSCKTQCQQKSNSNIQY